MIIITGGAGFIGSALVWGLNERGERDIVIVDALDHDEKEHNVAPLGYERLLGGNEFRSQLVAGEWDGADVRGVLHMGAISSTTEGDWQKLGDTNIAFTQEIVRWCADRGVRCVYASSGAVYGDGQLGYSDDQGLFDNLKPLNLYGKSKLVVDVWARDGGYLNSVAGVRYFNVFGPNEWHKGHMRSVVAKKFEEVRRGEALKLFKSNNARYSDGEQQRDFLYIKDAVAATLWLLDHTAAVGVYNVGTGRARTWNDVAKALFGVLGRPDEIAYVDLPDELYDQYQNFTQADISRLRAAGFRQEFMPVEAAVPEYVQQHLLPHRHLGEE